MGNLDPETGVRHPTYLKALIGPKLCDESPCFYGSERATVWACRVSIWNRQYCAANRLVNVLE